MQVYSHFANIYAEYDANHVAVGIVIPVAPSPVGVYKKTHTAVSNVVPKNNTRWRTNSRDFEKPWRRPEFKAQSRDTANLPDRKSRQMACVGLFKRLFRQQHRGL